MIDLRYLARALGGEVSGNQVRAPAIGHSRADRSLIVRLDRAAPGGILVHCFGTGDNPLAEKDRIRDLLGLQRSGGIVEKERNSSAGTRGESVDDVNTQNDAERTARALAIWREAYDPRGTPVESYFCHRSVELPLQAAAEAIRFHPSCPFAGKRTLAMVALVRDVLTNEPKAIHRTALTLDGQKAIVGNNDRLSLGPVARGAIKLTPDAEVTSCLGIGEGLESTLSMWRTSEFGSSPVWSLLSAGGLKAFPVLPGIECLWVAVDHDDAGLSAARSCAYRWRAAGAETFLITPSTPGVDLNDVFANAHHA